MGCGVTAGPRDGCASAVRSPGMGRGWPWPLLPQAGGAGRLGWPRPEFQSPSRTGRFPATQSTAEPEAACRPSWGGRTQRVPSDWRLELQGCPPGWAGARPVNRLGKGPFPGDSPTWWPGLKWPESGTIRASQPAWTHPRQAPGPSGTACCPLCLALVPAVIESPVPFPVTPSLSTPAAWPRPPAPGGF